MKFSGPYQPRLVHEQPILYLPSTSADFIGRGLGPDWIVDGSPLVTHPLPTAGFDTQFRRTRITSVAVTADQNLGLRLTNSNDYCLWRGNAESRGGFHFSARFIVFAIPDTDIRFFCGLTVKTDGQCITDTVQINTIGLWCDATDAASLSIVSRAGSGSATKNALTDAHTLTAGTLYEFVMIANPNDDHVVTQLINLETDAVISSQNIFTTLPASTAMMGPQVGLSNASNVVGGDTALDIVSVYCRPNLSLVPQG